MNKSQSTVYAYQKAQIASIKKLFPNSIYLELPLDAESLCETCATVGWVERPPLRSFGSRLNKSIGASELARLCLLRIWIRLLKPGFFGLSIFTFNFGNSSLDIENFMIGSPGLLATISERIGWFAKKAKPYQMLNKSIIASELARLCLLCI